MTTSTMAAMPSPQQVRLLLGDLVGRDVTVAPSDPYAGDVHEGATYALYVDDRLRPLAVVVLDGPLSAGLAGAIGLVPPAGVQEALADGVLTPVLRDNLREVLNVLSAGLNDSDHPHVRLHAMHDVVEPPYQAIRAWAATLGRRLDLAVEVPHYGAGRLSVVGVL